MYINKNERARNSIEVVFYSNSGTIRASYSPFAGLGNQLSSIHNSKGGPATKTCKRVKTSLSSHIIPSRVPSFLPPLLPIAQGHACQTRLAFCCARGERGRNGIAASALPLGTLVDIVEEGAQSKFMLNMHRKSGAAAEHLP